MAFRFVSSAGTITEPVTILMYASGVVHPGEVVEFSRTGGTGVFPASIASTVTNIFGVCLDYAQGSSDTQVRVIPFHAGQIWEADCVQSATTAQIGLRFGLNRTRGDLALYNIATDAATATAIFRAVAMTGLATGSGKLLGYFRRGEAVGVPNPESTTDTY